MKATDIWFKLYLGEITYDHVGEGHKEEIISSSNARINDIQGIRNTLETRAEVHRLLDIALDQVFSGRYPEIGVGGINIRRRQ